MIFETRDKCKILQAVLPMNEVSDVLTLSAYEDALYGISRELGSVTLTPSTLQFPLTKILRDSTGHGMNQIKTKLELSD